MTAKDLRIIGSCTLNVFGIETIYLRFDEWQRGFSTVQMDFAQILFATFAMFGFVLIVSAKLIDRSNEKNKCDVAQESKNQDSDGEEKCGKTLE